MGTWSKPLFTNKPNLFIDLTTLNDEIIELFERSSILTNGEKHKKINLGDWLSGFCETSKIYGYLQYDELKGWEKIFLEIKKQNNDVNIIELHFYCTDYLIPFSICYDYIKNELYMNECNPLSVEFFFDKKKYLPDYHEKLDDMMCADYNGTDYIFDDISYKKKWEERDLHFKKEILLSEEIKNIKLRQAKDEVLMLKNLFPF